MSALEEQLHFEIRALGLPAPVREFRFLEGRRYRADFAWPDRKLLVEVEGGTFVRGRHSRPIGMRNDCVKYNAAVLAGFRLLRFTPDMIRDGSALVTLQGVLTPESASPVRAGR